MNTQILKRGVFTLLLLLSMVTLSAQKGFSKSIIEALERADVATLSDALGRQAEVAILDTQVTKGDVEQRNRALNAFFAENRHNTFTVLHQGGTAESNFVVGTLQGQKESYRVNILIRSVDGVEQLQQLRIVRQ